jgi:hypothetical protein
VPRGDIALTYFLTAIRFASFRDGARVFDEKLNDRARSAVSSQASQLALTDTVGNRL